MGPLGVSEGRERGAPYPERGFPSPDPLRGPPSPAEGGGKRAPSLEAPRNVNRSGGKDYSAASLRSSRGSGKTMSSTTVCTVSTVTV